MPNIFLHSTGDVVWYMRPGECGPRNTGLNAERFVDNPAACGLRPTELQDYVTTLSPVSADLCLRLADAGFSGRVGNLRAQVSLVRDGQNFLSTLRQAFDRSADAGRWPSFEPGSVTYRTAMLMQEIFRHRCGTDLAQQVLQQHPAWKALSFLPRCDLSEACSLVTVIGHPRWFYSDGRFRSKSLLRNLGLTSDNEAQFRSGAVGTSYKGWRYREFVATARTWCYDVVPSDPEDPREFLHRTMVHHGGLVKAGRQLAMLVFFVWEAAVSSHPEVRFIPERLFRGPDEVKCWKQHERVAILRD